MDNQHKKISGYRDLSQTEIDRMNQIKALGEQVGLLVNELRTKTTDDKQHDQRWVSIGATHFQEGFMALVRSVAQPTTF